MGTQKVTKYTLKIDQKKILIPDLEFKSCVVGRSREVSDIVIKSSKLSRAHFELMLRNDKVYITDLDSSNGTYVNGEKLRPQERHLLKSKSKISCAKKELIFDVEEVEELAPVQGKKIRLISIGITTLISLLFISLHYGAHKNAYITSPLHLWGRFASCLGIWALGTVNSFTNVSNYFFKTNFHQANQSINNTIQYIMITFMYPTVSIAVASFVFFLADPQIIKWNRHAGLSNAYKICILNYNKKKCNNTLSKLDSDLLFSFKNKESLKLQKLIKDNKKQ